MWYKHHNTGMPWREKETLLYLYDIGVVAPDHWIMDYVCCATTSVSIMQ